MKGIDVMGTSVDPRKVDELAVEFKRLSSILSSNESGINRDISGLISQCSGEYHESYVRAAANELESLLREIRKMAASITERLDDKSTVLKQAAERYRKEEESAATAAGKSIGFDIFKNIGNELGSFFKATGQSVKTTFAQLLRSIFGKIDSKYAGASLALPPDISPLKINLTKNPKVYSEDVKKLQQRLRDLGYDIEVDGYFGKQTLAVVNAFKEKYGLANTGAYEGVVGNQTWLYLFGSLSGGLSIETKNYSEWVRMAQIRLKDRGYDVDATGYFDEKTKKAVNQFKDQQGLGNTGQWAGVIGPQTWNALFGSNIEAVKPVNLSEVVYYSQTDPKWKDILYTSCNKKSQTIGTSGCGPTSMAMVLSTLLGKTILPTQTAEFSLKNNFRTKDNGTSWAFFDKISKAYNINCRQTGSLDAVEKALKDGKHLVIASMKKGHFTKGGHFVVITGVEVRNGETWYKIYDPNKNNGNYKNDGKVDQGVKNDGIVLAKEVIVKMEANEFWIFDNPNSNTNINSGTQPVKPPKTEPAKPQQSDSGAMALSAAGMKFLHGSEGFSAYIYKDIANRDTIGYGHLIRPGEKFEEPMSKEAAQKLYEKDIERYINAVQDFEKKYNLHFTQNQKDALISFTYNLGENIWKAKSSTLRDLIVSGKYTDEELKKAFGAYHHCTKDGRLVDSNGLYSRRIDEAEVFLYGEYERRTDRKVPK